MSDNDVEEIDYLDDMLPMIGTICPLFEALEPESQREELRGLINGTWAPTESQGCSRRSSSIESSGSDGDGGEGEEEDINILAGICGASKAYLRHVLRDKFGGDLQRAAAWLLESPVAALERSWREEKLAEEVTCTRCTNDWHQNRIGGDLNRCFSAAG